MALSLLVGLVPVGLVVATALICTPWQPAKDGTAEAQAERPVHRRAAIGGPAGGTARGTWAGPAAGDEQTDRILRVLAIIPTDQDVLVNVTLDEMPGTPDLTRLGRAATAALSEGLLNNMDESVRSLCAQSLAEIADPAAAEALALALDDSSSDVRYQAVRALGNLGGTEQVKRLMELLRSPGEAAYVWAAAIHALGRIGDPRSPDILLALVHDKTFAALRGDLARALWTARAGIPREKLIPAFMTLLAADEATADLAIRSLGWLKADIAVDALASRYADAYPEVQNQIILAMGRIGGTKARAFLRTVVLETPYARHLNNAAIALAGLGDKPWVVADLTELLRDPRAYFRFNAAFALGEVGRDVPAAVDALIEALADANDLVRSEAAVALGRLQDPRSVPALEAAAESENPFVQLDVVVALCRMDGPRYGHLIFEKLLVHEEPQLRRIRERGIRLLAEAGDVRVVPHVLRYLHSGSPEDWDRALRLLDALPQFDQELFLPSLVQAVMAQDAGAPAALALIRDHEVQGTERFLIEAAYRAWDANKKRIYLALGEVASAADIPAIAAIPEESDVVRMYRDFALGNLGQQEAADRLLDVVRNGSLVQKRDAAFLLGFLDRPAAREQLVVLLQEGDPLTGVYAAYALLPKGVANAYGFLVQTMRSGSPALAEQAERAFRVSPAKEILPFLRRSLALERDATMKQRLAMLIDVREPREYR
jgi:HEAT repeat protein